MSGNLHPDFFAAAMSRQWRRGPLMKLFLELNTLAMDLFGNASALPAWFVLPSGAYVSLQYREDQTRVLRITRTEPFKTVGGPANFENEVATFVRHFQIAHWSVSPFTTDKAPVGVELVEPYAHSDPHVWCSRCKAELIKVDLAYSLDGQHCNGCAFAAGKEHTAEIHARIARENSNIPAGN